MYRKITVDGRRAKGDDCAGKISGQRVVADDQKKIRTYYYMVNNDGQWKVVN